MLRIAADRLTGHDIFTKNWFYTYGYRRVLGYIVQEH